MRCLFLSAFLVVLSSVARAEFANPDGIDNTAQLQLLVEESARTRQAIYVLAGLVLVQITAHGWRV